MEITVLYFKICFHKSPFTELRYASLGKLNLRPTKLKIQYSYLIIKIALYYIGVRMSVTRGI